MEVLQSDGIAFTVRPQQITCRYKKHKMKMQEKQYALSIQLYIVYILSRFTYADPPIVCSNLLDSQSLQQNEQELYQACLLFYSTPFQLRLGRSRLSFLIIRQWVQSAIPSRLQFHWIVMVGYR